MRLWRKNRIVFYWLIVPCLCITWIVYIVIRSQDEEGHFTITRILPLPYAKDVNVTHYLCPYFRGGLGNLMFMYSSLYGIAKRKHMILVLNVKDHITTVFPQISAMRKTNTVFCEQAEDFGEVRACAYDTETFGYDGKKNIRHKAYLQSWKYFEHVQDDIRKQFVFKPSVRQKAESVIKNYTKLYFKKRGFKKNLEIIGVHIRRGDYLKSNNIKFGYKVVTKDYIEKAFNYFRSNFSNCLFLVFTGPGKDDIKWRNDNVKGSDVMHVTANHRNVDMCALSMCNHTIITVGSFGWWSAWLSNGTTVYFKDVARHNSSLRKDFSKDMSDFFLPDWIGF